MYDRIRGLCGPFLLTAFVLFNAGAAAIADDSNSNNDAWHVSNAFGNVWVTVGGVQQASLSHARTLKPGDSIRTGQNGRALLVHGEEYILISPNSAIEIPRETKRGLLTTIIQRAGSIVLEVEKRNVKHFEVETPLLAALVKGTRFRVTVDENNSYVDVLRGQVEVSDLKSGQYALVQPGQTAKVSARRSGLSLSGSGTLSTIEQGTPRRSSEDPATETSERRAAADSIREERQINEASLHSDTESTQVSRRKSGAGQNMRFSLSIDPVQLSARVSKEDQSASTGDHSPGAASGQHVRTTLLRSGNNPGTEDLSNASALRQSADTVNDPSKSTDDSMRIILIVGAAFIVSSGISALRRRKKEKQN
jgi:hypothetical protein